MRTNLDDLRQRQDDAVRDMEHLDAQVQALPPNAGPGEISDLTGRFMQARSKASLLGSELEKAEAIAAAMRETHGGASVETRHAIARGSLRQESTYRPDITERSFFADVVNSKRDPLAAERLAKNQREQLELRDVTTADPGATGFIPPLYLGDLWASLPRAARPFADVVPSRPLPNAGMTISVPKVQTGVSVASQAAQLDAVSETDIDTESVSVPVCTIAGQNDISRQALERSFPGMDRVIFNDLESAYDSRLDQQLISGTGSNNQHLGIRGVTGKLAVSFTSGSPTAALLLPKVYDAISQVASNRFRSANVIVMHPRRAAWLGSQLSSTFPLFQQGTLTQAVGEQEGGFASSFGGLRVVLDANIATNLGSGTNEDEIYVLHVDDLMLLESPLRMLTFEDVGSGTLTVRLQVFSYSAFISARQPKSIAVIAGTGSSAPTF